MTTQISPHISGELRRIELRTRRSMSSDLMGSYRSAFRGSGLTFSDLREYQPGDDIKHIHWRATARSNTVYVKSYEEDRQLTLMFLVDTSRSLLFGQSKTKQLKALEFTSLLITLAEMSQDLSGLCLFSDKLHSYLPPRKGRSHLQRMLGALYAEGDLNPATDLRPALQALLQHQKRPVIVFLISDFIATDYEDDLRRVGHHHDLICVHIEDILDHTLPRVGIVDFEDAETGEHVLLDCSSNTAMAALRDQANRKRTLLEEICQRAGADLIHIDTDPLQPLTTLMRRRMARIR